MSKLPFADFTATTTATGTGLTTGRQVRSTPADFGAGLGRELRTAGRVVQGVAEREVRAKEQHESRQVQVDAARISTEFDEALNEGAKTGADLDEIREKFEDQLGSLQDTQETTVGTFQAQMAFERGRDVYGGMTRAAEAKRVGLQASNQTSELKDLLGRQVLKNPDALPIAQDEMVKLIDTFDLSPDQKKGMIDITDRELAQTAANSMLESDPARLKSLLLNGGIKGLNPGDQARFLSRANTEIEAAARKAKVKNTEADFQLMKGMSARANEGLVPDEERPWWFGEGASASQFRAMQTKAQKLHDERVRLAVNAEKVGQGNGASLSKPDYQGGVNQHIQDAIEGDTPIVAGQKAVEIRTDLAVRNGKEDSEIVTAISAGAVGGTNAFILGATYYNTMLEKSKTLAAKMADDSAETVYDGYNFYRAELGMSDEQAMETAQAALLERGQISADLQSKDNKELVEDALDELSTVEDVFTDNRFVRKELTKRVRFILASQPRLSVEQATTLGLEQFRRHNTQLDPGYWVDNKGIPEDFEEADNWVRRVEMKRAFEAMDLPEMPDALLLRLQFIPYPDGTARVLHPDTGQVLIPNFPWQEARDRWHTARRVPEEQRILELNRRRAEEQLEQTARDRAKFLEQKETLSATDLAPQALGL